MKIAIIGSNGFVGSNITNYLKTKHTVIGVTRQTVNVLDYYQLRQFLTKNMFDCIVICAATMANNIYDIQNNLGILTNFYNNRLLFGRLINTASGAEYDRSRDINCSDEQEIFKILPSDYYGLGQNLRSRLCVDTDNFYNLRIFNCFGQNEISTRIFPRLLQSKKDFIVYDDRYFDYFGIHDLCKVMDYYLDQTPQYKDINCVYDKKQLISQTIQEFNNIHKLGKNITVQNTSQNNYTGSHCKLYTLGLNLLGLTKSLQNYFVPVN